MERMKKILCDNKILLYMIITFLIFIITMFWVWSLEMCVEVVEPINEITGFCQSKLS